MRSWESIPWLQCFCWPESMYLSLRPSRIHYPTSITWLGQFRQLILTSILAGTSMCTHACVHSNIPERKLAHMQKYKLSSPGTWILVSTQLSLSWLFSFTCSLIMSRCTSNSVLLLLLSHFSHVQLCWPHRRQPTRLPSFWDSPGKNIGMGCHFLLQCMKVKEQLLSRVQLFATPRSAD